MYVAYVYFVMDVMYDMCIYICVLCCAMFVVDVGMYVMYVCFVCMYVMHVCYVMCV